MGLKIMDVDEKRELIESLNEFKRKSAEELNLREFQALHLEISTVKNDHDVRLATLQKAVDAQRLERDRFRIWGLVVMGGAAASMFAWFMSTIKWVVK